jgi:hypothetical protein
MLRSKVESDILAMGLRPAVMHGIMDKRRWIEELQRGIIGIMSDGSGLGQR